MLLTFLATLAEIFREIHAYLAKRRAQIVRYVFCLHGRALPLSVQVGRRSVHFYCASEYFYHYISNDYRYNLKPWLVLEVTHEFWIVW